MAVDQYDGNPAGQQLKWLIDALDDPSGLTVADIDARFDARDWRDWSPEGEIEFLRDGRHAASRPFTVEDVVSPSGCEATATLIGADGKRWSVTCWTDEAPPHRITGARTMPAPPVGTTIRLATLDDAEVLGELERRAPLRLGHEPLTLMTFDHGDDYFAPSRLMEEQTTYVAEVDGAVAGVYCGVVQPVRHDGEPKRLFLEHHVRIDPATARGGVFWALCVFGRDVYARTTDSIAFYVSVHNHPVRKFVENVPPWSVRPLRMLIPCTRGAEAGAGDDRARAARPATAADVAAVTEVLNACHRNSGLFVPYDDPSFTTRLSRDPEQYDWSDVLLAPGAAAVGVGQRLLTVTKERAGAAAVTHRALALDHGFTAGNEETYRRLLLQWCAVLAERGATHLAVFTSECSSTYPVLSDLADEVEEFDFWAFDLDEPRALAEGGFYVDPVYF